MPDALSSAERVARRRAKLQSAGLRPIQLWVPDTKAPGFAEECRRQSKLIREQETDGTRADDDAWERVSWEASNHEPG